MIRKLLLEFEALGLAVFGQNCVSDLVGVLSRESVSGCEENIYLLFSVRFVLLRCSVLRHGARDRWLAASLISAGVVGTYEQYFYLSRALGAEHV